MISDGKNEFQRDWGFISEVRDTIPGTARHQIRLTDSTFGTGRKIYEATFYGAGNVDGRAQVITKRCAMELVSKRTGNPYFVVRRKADPPAKTDLRVDASTSADLAC